MRLRGLTIVDYRSCIASQFQLLCLYQFPGDESQPQMLCYLLFPQRQFSIIHWVLCLLCLAMSKVLLTVVVVPVYLFFVPGLRLSLYAAFVPHSPFITPASPHCRFCRETPAEAFTSKDAYANASRPELSRNRGRTVICVVPRLGRASLFLALNHDQSIVDAAYRLGPEPYTCITCSFGIPCFKTRPPCPSLVAFTHPSKSTITMRCDSHLYFFSITGKVRFASLVPIQNF